jgi:hypothetical protein
MQFVYQKVETLDLICIGQIKLKKLIFEIDLSEEAKYRV